MASGELSGDAMRFPGPEQRSFLARELLVHQVPEVPAGTQFLYSNAGFALAGHALEEKLQSPWEALLVKRITRPLGLRSVGFGCTASTES
jgi:D-alanyl-D-alanine carboxypeptidase